jgi:pimeloyl-ACP methyl ester carboxylesterase
MKVIFSHGKESGPWGSKIRRLAAIAELHNCKVESIDYSDLMNPDERVARLSALLQQETDTVVLVGSSMGGYVSLVTAMQCPTKVKGVFVLAPALYMPHYAVQSYPLRTLHHIPVAVVHGWDDDVIPAANAYRFALENRCSIHLIDGDHRLNESLDVIEPIFAQFLAKLAG